MRKRLCVSGQREFSLEERLTKYNLSGPGAPLQIIQYGNVLDV